MELSKREIEIIIRNLEFDNNIPNISTEERVSLLTKLRLVNKTNDIHDVSCCDNCGKELVNIGGSQMYCNTCKTTKIGCN